MQETYEYKRYAILYVDDEEKSLKYFARSFKDRFRILTASNAKEGFQTFTAHKDEIGLIMTDQRMPGEQGVQLLEKARQLRPQVIRILATAFTDIDAAISAVNTGAIYKYVTKPWDVAQLENTLQRGLEFFIVQEERDRLFKEKMSVLQSILVADRVVSLSVLAAGLGHHVRNSLVAVRTFLDLAPAKLREEKADPNELKNPNFWSEFYKHVQSQIRRITEMLTDLGAASEMSAAAFTESVCLSSILDETLASLQDKFSEKQIKVETQLPENLPEIRADRWKFRRLFELLFLDEIINLPPGGRIQVQARTRANGAESPKQLEVDIIDNGPGLPEEALRSIFDPFFSRNDNPQEFGVYLMTVYFLVYHHGGNINVKSAEGRGTTFQLSFPLEPQTRPNQLNEDDFLRRALWNDDLWNKLLAGR